MSHRVKKVLFYAQTPDACLKVKGPSSNVNVQGLRTQPWWWRVRGGLSQVDPTLGMASTWPGDHVAPAAGLLWTDQDMQSCGSFDREGRCLLLPLASAGLRAWNPAMGTLDGGLPLNFSCFFNFSSTPVLLLT